MTEGTGVLLVTGASRGIGAAVARLAGGRGHDVCVNYRRDADAAARVVRDVEDAEGRAFAVEADVGSEAGVAHLFEAADARPGPLVGLVSNAGILERQMRVEDMDAARLERVLRVNVTGTLLCAREAVRRMSTRRGGSGGAIVTLGSRAARLGAPGEYVDYAASKAAVETFTVGLAREVAGEGIRVNAVSPGVIDTDIHASGGEPGRIERVKEAIPMRRAGHAEEVAAAILWLLSDEASYVTGAVLEVGGGR